MKLLDYNEIEMKKQLKGKGMPYYKDAMGFYKQSDIRINKTVPVLYS